MPLVSHKSAPASCGHVQTGSSRVFVQGNGVSRVEVDTAGGLIIGPGSQNVFVENIKVSLVGDAIASHGKSPHSSARTTSTQQKVFVGTGFAGDSASTGFAPRPDIITTQFTTNYGNGIIELFCSGTGIYPPTNMQNAFYNCADPNSIYSSRPSPPNLTYSYEIKNTGTDTSQPQTVGFWRFTDTANAPTQAILTIQAAETYPDAVLVATADVPSLLVGQTFSGTFVFPEVYRADIGDYVFGVYPDIYQTVTEPDEQNSIATIRVRVSNACG
jgi:hypothetical protein|tara:strand:- start:1871 stop:2686 length:816 start_codon:yes stop_codon:yes gene_type:complete